MQEIWASFLDNNIPQIRENIFQLAQRSYSLIQPWRSRVTRSDQYYDKFEKKIENRETPLGCCIQELEKRKYVERRLHTPVQLQLTCYSVEKTLFCHSHILIFTFFSEGVFELTDTLLDLFVETGDLTPLNFSSSKPDLSA